MSGVSFAWRRPSGRTLLSISLFAYLCFARLRGVSQSFWLAGDQVRDWTFALGSWRDLPLTGAPSTAGGASLGPVYYWTLWIIRHLIGPFTDNLPHAGGIGLSLLQSAADVVLFAAIGKRTGSSWLALAVVLTIATGPYDMALTATIWNPPLAVIFVKLTIALVLLAVDRPSLWWTALTTATAWMAVQTHSSAIFASAPALALFPARDALARQWRSAFERVRLSIEVILVLQVPFLLSLLRQPASAVGPSRVIDNVLQTAANPETLRVRASYEAVSAATGWLLFQPWSIPAFNLVLLACALVTLRRWRRDLDVLSVTVAPLACAAFGFALWQGAFDNYWFLAIAPSAALTIGLALTAWTPSRTWVAAALTVAIVAAQPARVAFSRTFHRLPEYGPLVRGSRQIARQTGVVRGIQTDLRLPDTLEADYIYRLLGGQVTADAPLDAVIGTNGVVTFKPRPPAP